MHQGKRTLIYDLTDSNRKPRLQDNIAKYICMTSDVMEISITETEVSESSAVFRTTVATTT